MKSKFTIFYSWQSDIPTNKKFIQSSIDKAVRELNRKRSLEFNVEINVDRDTKDMSGSPAIAATIFEKIRNSDIFICDVTLINNSLISRLFGNRLTPNPNVLIELGYAIHTLGWDRIICVNNLENGPNETLPFDLRGHRISIFSGANEHEKSKLIATLTAAIKSIVDDYPDILKKHKFHSSKLHDQEIFKQTQELLTEKNLDDDLNVVVGSLHYKASDTARWISFIRFYDNTLNRFIDEDVHSTFSNLVKQLDEFKNLVMTRITRQVDKGKRLYEYEEPITEEIRHEVNENTWFFVSKDPFYEETQMDADRRVSGYSRELNDAADKVVAAYKEFIMTYKRNVLVN